MANTKWEYLVLQPTAKSNSDLLIRHLNDLGQMGWELVSAVLVPADVASPGVAVTTCYFKRAVG